MNDNFFVKIAKEIIDLIEKNDSGLSSMRELRQVETTINQTLFLYRDYHHSFEEISNMAIQEYDCVADLKTRLNEIKIKLYQLIEGNENEKNYISNYNER